MKRAPKGKRFKLQAKPLTEELIKFFVEHYEQNGSFPGSKIPCSVTGKLTTCVGPWMRKKVKEFGSAENLLRNYTCRNIKKQKISLKEETIPNVYIFEGPKPLSGTDIQNTTQGCCLRPDLYLNNNRNCYGCEYAVFCESSLKQLRKVG